MVEVSRLRIGNWQFDHFAANFELRFVDSEAQLFNVDLETRPLMIHGNGPSKRHLNHLGNYLPKAWNEVDQCTSCWEDVIDFEVRLSLLQNTLNQTSNPVLAIFFRLSQKYRRS